METESCSKQETCSKFRIARFSRTRPCCRSAEPAESVCARCEERLEATEREPVLAA